MIEAERIFDARDALAAELARDVADELHRAIEAKGKATLAVSGGSTPKLFFEKLSEQNIPWARVTVTLVDERQVPETSERSNARLVREHLLKNKAAAASFVPLFNNAEAEKMSPFDVAILGMGADGHTASFFPGADRLAEAIDAGSDKRLIAITAPGAGEPRLTFTLPVIEKAGRLAPPHRGAGQEGRARQGSGRWPRRGHAGARRPPQCHTRHPLLVPVKENEMSVTESISAVTEKIVKRSRDARARYLDKIDNAIARQPKRKSLGCANVAHGFAACGTDKDALRNGSGPNLAIVTAYNDMLSAHQPFETYPELIRKAAREAGGTAQVAGGVPAMCDGVTQGETGMELSLFSRDVIALSTAVALSHQMFDAAVYLGVCDKIVPGLIIGALSFGHLPAVFVPAGPMTSGLPNDEKGKIRQLYAEGKVGRDALLEAECKSYHGPGTCTFYGTANSNQMLMEIMGLHLPGSTFVNPGTPLRDAITASSAKQALSITALGNEYRPIGRIYDEKAVVNGVVGLLATGGSTNHTMHLIAMAAAAGIAITWDDFAALSKAVPLLTRVYPNGKADVNHFNAAGGMGFLIRELLGAGLLHEDVSTIMGEGLSAYTKEAKLGADGELVFAAAPEASHDESVLRGAARPFQPTGGLQVLTGSLGISVIKTSSIPADRHVIEAPARVFHSQEELQAAFKAGEMNRDVVAVVRFQGPKANGMPELHRLTPPLAVLQDKGFRVALVTDGRMSGASGKVPAAIHLTPEAVDGGPIAKIRDGDIIRLDAETGRLDVLDVDLATREAVKVDLSANTSGTGRELFAAFRAIAGRADAGASIFESV